MMPADLVYALSSQRQRDAMNTARARRIAAHDASKALIRERKKAARTGSRTVGRRGRVRARVRATLGCTA